MRLKMKSENDFNWKRNTSESTFLTPRMILDVTEQRVRSTNKHPTDRILQAKFEKDISSIKKQKERVTSQSREYLISSRKYKNRNIEKEAFFPVGGKPTQEIKKTNDKFSKPKVAELNILDNIMMGVHPKQIYNNGKKENIIGDISVKLHNKLVRTDLQDLFAKSENTEAALSLLKEGDTSMFKKLNEDRLQGVLASLFKVYRYLIEFPKDDQTEVVLLAMSNHLRDLGDSYYQGIDIISSSLLAEKRKNALKSQIQKERKEYGTTRNTIEKKNHDMRTMSFFIDSLNNLITYLKLEKNFISDNSAKAEQCSVAYKEFCKNRAILKVRDNSTELYNTLCYIDDYFSSFKEKFDNLKLNNRVLTEENVSMSNLLKQAGEKLEHEKFNMIEFNEMVNMKLGPNEAQITKKLEENYHEIIDDLDHNNKKLSHEKERMNANLVELEYELNQLRAEKRRKNKLRNDQETQTVFEIGVKKHQMPVFSELFERLEISTISGVVQRKEWVASVINHCLSLMMKKELELEASQRSPSILKEFLIEYFLSRFGSPLAARQMMIDFIVSLKEHYLVSDRFRLFAQFCGLDTIIDTNFIQFTKRSKSRIDSVRNFYFRSYAAVRDYLEIIAIYNSFREEEDESLRPMIPFDLGGDSCLIPVRLASYVLGYFLAKERISYADVSKVEIDFTNLIKEDLYSRLYDKKKGASIRNFRDEENYIHFDTLAKYLINRKVQKLVAIIQKFLTSLTMNSGGVRGDNKICYSDIKYSSVELFPHQNEAWMMRVFRNLVDIPPSQAKSLDKTIDFSLTSLIDSDKVQETFANCFFTPSELKRRGYFLEEAEKKLNEIERGRTYKGDRYNVGVYHESLMQWLNEIGQRRSEIVQDVEKYRSQLGDIAEAQNMITSDTVSSLAALQESYICLKHPILMAEKTSDLVQNIHSDIKEFLSNLPPAVGKNGLLNTQTGDPKSFHNKLENMWNKMMRMITFLYYSIN